MQIVIVVVGLVLAIVLLVSQGSIGIVQQPLASHVLRGQVQLLVQLLLKNVFLVRMKVAVLVLPLVPAGACLV